MLPATMDPLSARVISQDPLGFDGGDTNLYRYVRNNPTNQTDPEGLAAPGLTVKQTFAPVLGYFGSFVWGVEWKLTQNTTKGGVIIQYLNVTFNVTNAKDKKVRIRADDNKWSYFEAWVVPKGTDTTNIKQRLTAQLDAYIRAFDAQKAYVDALAQVAQGPFQQALQNYSAVLGQQSAALKQVKAQGTTDDYFSVAGGTLGTKGTIRFNGRAFFAECVTVKDLRKYGFITRNPNTHAGILYSIPARTVETVDAIANAILPNNDSVSNEVPHNITVSWDATDRAKPNLFRTAVVSKTP